ncbi:response regulator transcription factor [Paenibacillus sp. IITD108]|uniref:response regulator transcription factor n=1 Tax=Paenibacillus sp. IITD108 TaxID=3116649 RepID=UPI002F3FB01C
MHESTKINVLLVEDDPFWIEQLSDSIKQQEDMYLVDVAITKEEAIKTALKYTPDVMVLDINLTENNLDGIEVAKEASNITRTIMLSSVMEDEVIWDAFDYGAVNFLAKSSSHEIISAIRDAYCDKSSIHADVAAVLRKGFKRERREVKLQVLTSAERLLYELEEDGMTKGEMATRLHKSLETIKSQFKSIRKKMRERGG